jgi:RNA polymerase sigma-70 factor, ECF subfamily
LHPETFIKVKNMPDWDAVDDIQLLRQAQYGSAEAFGELYERHALSVFRFLYAHLDDRLDAEDLTEEVFLRTWRSLARYRDQGVPFKAFLFRVAHNALIDHYRANRRSGSEVSIEDSVIHDQRSEPGSQFLQNQEHQELRNTLAQLREDYQTVLISRFLVGLSPDETAQVMGRSIGAVRVLQHRALSALRKLMEGVITDGD